MARRGAKSSPVPVAEGAGDLLGRGLLGDFAKSEICELLGTLLAQRGADIARVVGETAVHEEIRLWLVYHPYVKMVPEGDSRVVVILKARGTSSKAARISPPRRNSSVSSNSSSSTVSFARGYDNPIYVR